MSRSVPARPSVIALVLTRYPTPMPSAYSGDERNPALATGIGAAAALLPGTAPKVCFASRVRDLCRILDSLRRLVHRLHGGWVHIRAAPRDSLPSAGLLEHQHLYTVRVWYVRLE